MGLLLKSRLRRADTDSGTHAVSELDLMRRRLADATAGAAGRSEGTPPRPRLVAWRSSDAGIAAVDANGVVVALAVGSVDITARAGLFAVAQPVSVGVCAAHS